MNVSEVRAHMREVLERVKRGEEVTLTQNGEAVAVMLQPSRVQARRAAAQKAIDEGKRILDDINALRGKPLDIGRGISTEEAEQWVRELRAEREA